MNNSSKNKGTARSKKAVSQKANAPVEKNRKPWGYIQPRHSRCLTYGLGFAALFIFLTFGYGEVLSRAEQFSYISTSPDTMHYLLSKPMGSVFWLMRWILLLFKWSILGGAFLALVYTLTARLTDYALRLPRRWEGLGFTVALGQIGWMAWRGTNLYYKNEPSLFIFIALVILAVSALLALAVWFFRSGKKTEMPERLRPYGLVAALVLTGGTGWAVCHFNENVILTARLQRLTWEQDWDTIIKDARSAKRPTRAVAAYHAIALLQTNQLLEGMFEIPYDFPKLKLDARGGSEEYGIFLSDCSYQAGLFNVGYRTAMDQMVMTGPRLSNLKQLALCSLLNGEYALCEKYLTLISRTPFEDEFVERYRNMIQHPELISADPTFANIFSRKLMEDNFEQNYMPPAFLGYNIGLSKGSDATLITSAAACLYSKDLNRFLIRAQIMAQKGMSFPPCMQEAIAILSLKDPNIMKSFSKQVNSFVSNELTSFLMDAKPYINDRIALRHELRDRWLGTYAYYYYTENNDPDQVTKSYDTEDKAGVN